MFVEQNLCSIVDGNVVYVRESFEYVWFGDVWLLMKVECAVPVGFCNDSIERFCIPSGFDELMTMY